MTRPSSAARLFSAYDDVRIVSLPERTDRRRILERHLRGLGIEPASWAYEDAERKEIAWPFQRVGSHGAFWTHHRALSRAGREGRSILILQDDVAFFETDALIPSAPIVYGGWTIEPATGYLHGAHCMGFTAQAARSASDYILDRYRRAKMRNEVCPPIDGLLADFRRDDPRFGAAFVRVSTQRPSRSDCTPGIFDRLPIARELMALARRLKPMEAL